MSDLLRQARARVRSLPPAAFEERDTVQAESSRNVRRQSTQLPTAADLFVPSLPGLPNLAAHHTHPLTLHAGLLPSYPGEGQGGGEGETGKDAALFFLKVESRRSAGPNRLLLWFNGGPGCSSFDGSLMEVGPFRTVPASQTESGQVELKLVEGGWEEYATVVFIDQPPGTGLSYAPTNGYLHELDQGSQHLIKFLQNFYEVFPEYQGVDTYLSGESFAGQYIPYFADALLKKPPLPNFNLVGIAIGNGWIDPKQQYPGYAEFGYEKGLIKPGTPEADALDKALDRCREEMAKFTDPLTTPTNIDHCGEVMDHVSKPYEKELNGKKVCMNVYDVRLVDDYPACGMNWPPDLPDVYSFLRRPDVVSALHATKKDTAWVECDNKVGSELHLKNSPAAVAWLPTILEKGVQVMMFAGAEDLICNYKGIERMLDHLEWSGEVGMGNATRREWYLNDTQVGLWQESRNMTYVKVFDSSHMVGFDVPDVTNDMIMRFMNVDVAMVPGHAAASKSRIGDDERIVIGEAGAGSGGGLALLKGGKTDWEAAYNVFSAFLILFILLSIVGLYFFFRRRAHLRLKRGGPVMLSAREDGVDEERVPLGSRAAAEEYELEDNGMRGRRTGKGKGKDMDGELHGGQEEDGERGETVFALGDEDDEDAGKR